MQDDNLEKTENGDEANSRIKFHLNGRLRKAADWSQRLAEICAVRADAYVAIRCDHIPLVGLAVHIVAWNH